MQHRFSSTLGWQNGESQEHSIALELDLTVSDFMTSRDITLELIENVDEIRRELYEACLNEVLPQIIQHTGWDWESFPIHLECRYRAECKRKSKIREPRHAKESLTVESRQWIAYHIQTNIPLNALQAIHHCRYGLATAIAENVLIPLREKYLGIKSGSATIEYGGSGDIVTGYDVQDKIDFEGN